MLRTITYSLPFPGCEAGGGLFNHHHTGIIDMAKFIVRTGHGAVQWDGEFTDAVETADRRPRLHRNWESVTYKGKRYQLFGGIRTPWFICLNHPLRSKGN